MSPEQLMKAVKQSGMNIYVRDGKFLEAKYSMAALERFAELVVQAYKKEPWDMPEEEEKNDN